MDILAGLHWGALGFFAYVGALLVALIVVVFVHEYGHFKVARLCGVVVETFSIGFGREIVGWNDRFGTRWKIAWVPLGGYVKFRGDANAASMPTDGSAIKHAEPGDFHAAPVWKRAAIVAAGPIANFVLAVVIFAAVYISFGTTVIGTTVGAVRENSAAAAVGIQPGDKIIAVDGMMLDNFDDLVKAIVFRPGEHLQITLDRGGTRINKDIVPQVVEESDGIGGKIRLGRIGIEPSRDDQRHVRLGPIEAVSKAVSDTWFIIKTTLNYVGKLLLGYESTDKLGGAGSMAAIAGNAASQGFFQFTSVIALFSVSIGLINLFPIPILDGGHLVFYALESVRRRPLSPVAQEWSFRLGFAMILFIMLVGNGNDLMRGIRYALGL
jgi:regulator of sigma E protease